MTKTILFTVFVLLFSTLLWHCNPGKSDSIANISDTQSIRKGEQVFNMQCSNCHNFRQNGIGPQLSGITMRQKISWIKEFINDPIKIIASGDPETKELMKKYKPTMPSFKNLSNEDLDNVIEFLNTHQEKIHKHGDYSDDHLNNPIPDSIKNSGLVAEIKMLIQIPSSADKNTMPLTRINKLDFEPTTGMLYVSDQRGKLFRIVNNKVSGVMDLKAVLPNFINQPGLATGLGSFAFHPDFAKNGLLYTAHSEAANSKTSDFYYQDSIKQTLQWVLMEWKCNDPKNPVFKAPGRELLRVNFVTQIHGVQEIIFNPLSKHGDKDYGLLYIGVGEGGAVENGFPFLTHRKDKIWGTILRIDPLGTNSKNGKYGIPIDNPFVNDKNALGEIYAFGFRNPHRITWTKKGLMLVSNVGHGNIESIYNVLRGHDHGWPIREGSFLIHPDGDLNNVYPLPVNDSSYHITYPIAEYDHDEGKAISGGYEYWGTEIPVLKGKFLFGDIPTGRLFYFDIADIHSGKNATIKEWKLAINGSVKSLAQICGSNRIDLHFGRDKSGEIYILTKADGKIYKVTSAHIQK